MMRRSFAFAILTLLLFVFLSGTAGAEEADPATPTDLDCAHEHVKTTIYFFDSPSYISISSVSHRVSGPAAVETVCLDCGKTLSSETVSNAEEIRPHSMKRGVCALCGYREKARTENPVADMPGERTLFAEQDEKAKGLMTLTLTRTDLSVLNRADIGTVLVRGETGCAVVVLDVAEILSQVKSGIGKELYYAKANFLMADIFAWTILIILISSLFDYLISLFKEKN